MDRIAALGERFVFGPKAQKAGQRAILAVAQILTELAGDSGAKWGFCKVDLAAYSWDQAREAQGD